MTTASNDPGQPALAALEARLAATETALASERADRRRAEVTSLFASAGRPAPDEARMNHYLSLSPEQWSAVAADLHLPRAAAPDHLFSEQATDGLAKDRQQADDALVARMAALN